MKAAVLEDYGKPLAIKDVQKPQIRPGEVLIKVAACGVCRTDLKIIEGMAWKPNLPHVLGHEVAGFVESGEGLENFKKGDSVVVNQYYACGVCYYCRIGSETLCTNLKGHLGFDESGGFGEYVKAPERNLIKIPDGVALEEAAVAGCAVGSSLHAVKRSNIRANQTALVQGAGGGLGVSTVQLLKLSGVNVIGVGISGEEVKTAKRYGADSTINAKEISVVEAVKKLTDGLGPDVVFDFVGVKETVEPGFQLLRPGGKMVVVGYGPEPFQIAAQQLTMREIEVIGCRSATRQDIVDVLEMSRKGKLAPVVNKILKLEEINTALRLLKDHAAVGRSAIKF
ncbi:MAG TPA: alcohol dehydrogenase catalytic domain-containing protein [Candidatus Bathyarchaeia archaeon]|nr:alcohol dehydrogenase catalytic domain-containing protein [Candidatus Bathyarchaeia archaeon]